MFSSFSFPLSLYSGMSRPRAPPCHVRSSFSCGREEVLDSAAGQGSRSICRVGLNGTFLLSSVSDIIHELVLSGAEANACTSPAAPPSSRPGEGRELRRERGEWEREHQREREGERKQQFPRAGTLCVTAYTQGAAD